MGIVFEGVGLDKKGTTLWGGRNRDITVGGKFLVRMRRDYVYCANRVH